MAFLTHFLHISVFSEYFVFTSHCPGLSPGRLYYLVVIWSSWDSPRDHIKFIMELTKFSIMSAITSLESSSLLLKVLLWDGWFQMTCPKSTKHRQPVSPAIESQFILAHIHNWFYDQPLLPRAQYYCTVHTVCRFREFVSFSHVSCGEKRGRLLSSELSRVEEDGKSWSIKGDLSCECGTKGVRQSGRVKAGRTP